MTINRFDPNGDRHAPLEHVVSFHDVPMYRVQAWVYWDCERHGAKVSIASAIRVDSIVQQHNHQYGTNLHGQQYAIDHAGQPGWSAADPINLTSHCGHSDGALVYVDEHGHHIPAKGVLPKYEWGVDADDLGKVEDNSHLLHVSHQLGYLLAAPYRSGSERHHLIIARDPVHVLESRNVISKDRHS